MTTIYSSDGTTVTRRYRDVPRWHWQATSDTSGEYVDATVEHGYFPLVESDRPADSDDGTHDYTIVRDGDTFVETWTPRAFTVDEQAARRADANMRTIDDAITQALTELAQLVNAPDVPDVPSGTMNNAQLSNTLREMRERVQQNRNGIKRVARTLRHTIRLARGDFDGVD